MISSLGSSFLIIALFLNIYTIFSMGIFLKYKKYQFKISSINSLYCSTLLIILSSFILIRELIQSNFNIAYISKYSSTNTPLIYKITGFWAGIRFASVLVIRIVYLFD